MQLGVQLPSLCSCHTTPVLDPAYPEHCCINCPLHNNQPLYNSMLRSLLHTYGVLV